LRDSVIVRVVHTDRNDGARMHMFGNLAEDIWCAFRDDPRVECDLLAVDRGSDTLVVTARTGLKGRTVQMIGRIIKKHMMEDDVQIEAG
jgi:hypothetical protein